MIGQEVDVINVVFGSGHGAFNVANIRSGNLKNTGNVFLRHAIIEPPITYEINYVLFYPTYIFFSFHYVVQVREEKKYTCRTGTSICFFTYFCLRRVVKNERRQKFGRNLNS